MGDYKKSGDRALAGEVYRFCGALVSTSRVDNVATPNQQYFPVGKLGMAFEIRPDDIKYPT